MSQRPSWPDQWILGQWAIVIPRAKGEELRHEMEEKGSPIDVGLIGPLHPIQLNQIVFQIQMTTQPPPTAERLWRFSEPRWVN